MIEFSIYESGITILTLSYRVYYKVLMAITDSVIIYGVRIRLEPVFLESRAYTQYIFITLYRDSKKKHGLAITQGLMFRLDTSHQDTSKQLTKIFSK